MNHGKYLALLVFALTSILFLNPLYFNAFAQPSVGSSTTHGPPFDWTAHPPIHVKRAATSSPTGLMPSQIVHAYGFDQLSCYGIQNCGAGQTIAIVDAYDDPNIGNDLATFSTQFGLPQCTSSNGCFTKATPQGLPRSDQGWALEESLDVEWVHAIAPGAKIILVEARSNSFNNLLGAIDYAATQAGVHQVSMSWGGTEFSGETSYDGHFQVSGVSFTASSGDSGTGVQWPAVSPYVVGVGGTTLSVDSIGNVQSETAWSGSGGGVSAYEPMPTYQNGFNQYTDRGVPDVSYDADPSTGVPVYDSFGYQGSSGWFQVGGTSAGSPQWTAAIAIANSGRTTPLSSMSSGTETNLYSAAGGTSYNLNNIYYRDIISGNNGACGSICMAAAGYDFVTGLGSPLSNNLIPYLQPSSIPTFTVSSSPSSLTISAGGSAQSQITVASTNGFSGTVSLSTSASPGLTSTLGSSSLTIGGSVTSASTTLTISAASGAGAGSYSVTVTGTGGMSSSTAVQVTVQTIPTAPTALTATAGNAQVALSWTAPSNNGGSSITGYDIYRGITSGGEGTAPIATVTSTSYTDTAVTNGQTYYYYVTAVNAIGQSAPSNEAFATPQSSLSTPALSVSVSANQPSYTQNSFAYITAAVTSNSSPVSGASVTLNVCAANNGGCSTETGTTGSDGQVTFQFKIMPHATLGTYTATAQASAAGYTSSSGQTTFQVT